MTTANGRTFLGYVMNDNFTPEQADVLWPDADIVEEVLNERLKQYEKFGDQNNLSQHEFLAILTEEVGEIAKDINDITYAASTIPPEDYISLLKNLRNEWLQTAAVAVQGVRAMDAILEKHGIKNDNK